MDFLQNNSIYVTLIVAGVILLGILIYLVRLDRRLRTLEQESKR